jgi:FecR protein
MSSGTSGADLSNEAVFAPESGYWFSRGRPIGNSPAKFVTLEEVLMVGLRTVGGFLTIVVLTTTPVYAQQPAAAGHIKIATGSAFIVRQNATLPAKPGDAVYAIDTLKTDADGTLGVTLMDDTRLSLGPSSEVRLERYVFSPAEGGLGMVLNFVRGVAAYVSGRMAKLAPDAIRLETPAAIVGVRGTTVAIKVGA